MSRSQLVNVVNGCVAITCANCNSCNLTRISSTASWVGDVISPVRSVHRQYIVFTGLSTEFRRCTKLLSTEECDRYNFTPCFRYTEFSSPRVLSKLCLINISRVFSSSWCKRKIVIKMAKGGRSKQKQSKKITCCGCTSNRSSDSACKYVHLFFYDRL